MVANSRYGWTGLAVAVAMFGGVAPAAAQKAPKPLTPAQVTAAAADASYDELFTAYLQKARQIASPRAAWIADLMSDPRAKHVNDLVTIQIAESVSATGTADASVTKSSSAKVDFPLPLANKLAKIVPNGSDTKFAGTGTTSRGSNITATLTARVAEVLPNGDLVVEGVRELDVNGDRQIAVLTGVVRQADIAANNTVPSAVIGQLRIRYLGRGLIKDSLTPGWLVRVLNKIF